MKKLFILFILCILCISVYAVDSKLVSFDILDDKGKSTGRTYLAYKEDKSGTFTGPKGSGSVNWNVRIYPKNGEIYFVLKEEGKDKDVSTSGSGRSADIGCVYAVTFKTSADGPEKNIYGGLKISSGFQANELLCYADSSLSNVLEDKEFLAENAALDVSIKSDYGSYSLGRLNLDGIEELLFDKAPYLEGIKLMEEGKYQEAIEVLEKYRDENLEAFAHYNTWTKVDECYDFLGVYSIGSTGPAGGWIFYDCDADNDSGNADGLISSECGWRYLEAAPADLYYEYGGFGTIGSKTAIGKGKANTAAIINKLGAGGYAAKACWDYEYNDYDDWFLPSKDELNLMYVNLKNKGIGNFKDDWYWSSSENDYDDAWKQNFSNGAQNSYGRYGSGYVRPIRTFI